MRPDSIRSRLRRVMRLGGRLPSIERDIDEELRFHFDSRIAALVASGMSEAEARRMTEREFGDLAAARTELADVDRRIRSRRDLRERMEWVTQDLRYAARGLARTPGFTLTVILTLALGLGVNGALFSIIDRLFLRAPTGVTAPGEVRQLYFYRANHGGPLNPPYAAFPTVSYPAYAAIRATVGDSTPVGAYIGAHAIPVEVNGTATSAMRAYSTHSYFTASGVKPAIGRFFSPDEDRVDVTSPVLVISQAFQRRVFGSETDVVGKQVQIEKVSYTVIGVAGGGFAGLDLGSIDLWLPLGDYPTPRVISTPWYACCVDALGVVARTRTQAAEDRLRTVATFAYRASREREGNLDSIAHVALGPIFGLSRPGHIPLEARVATRLLAVALIVLLIACGNIANLLLLRANGRRREIAVRRALGVSRLRLYRQLLIESVLLSSLAAVAAIVVAIWTHDALANLLFPGTLWELTDFGSRLAVFIAGISVLTGVCTGLAPIVNVSRASTADVLRADAHTNTQRRAWLRSALVVLQGALTVVLLVGAGLFLRSLNNVDAIDVGFQPSGLLAIRPWYYRQAGIAYRTPDVTGVVSHLVGRPGIKQIAVASVPPMEGRYVGQFFIAGRDSALRRDGEETSAVLASPEYAETVGLHIASGRFFTADDRAGSERVAVVNDATARFAWPGANPIGQCLFVRSRSAPCTRVIGVVKEVHFALVVEDPWLQVFLPLAQNPWDDRDPGSPFFERIVLIRAQRGATAEVTALARRVGRQYLPDADEIRVLNISQDVDNDLRPWRIGAALFTALGALAVLIAGIGVYSVFSYAVSQRTREMGIRVALGAQLLDILRIVLDDAVRLVAIGAVIGVGLALAFGRLVASQLYGVSAHDPVVMLGGVVLLVLLGIGASLAPALRAGRVDPGAVLRTD